MSAGRYFCLLLAWLAIAVGGIAKADPIVGVGHVIIGLLVGWDLVWFIKWAISKFTREAA